MHRDLQAVERQVARDGTERARIATGLFRATEPSWSPDGRRIAFAGSTVAGAPFRIYVIEAPVD
jgi:Tol biopolymer transport system component